MRYRTEEISKKLEPSVRALLADYGVNINSRQLKWELRRFLSTYDAYSDRCRKLMDSFKPSETDIQKIIEMNDGLYQRFKTIWNQMLEMKAKIDTEIKEKKLQVSGYTIRAEYFFCYNYDDKGIPTADGDLLMLLSDNTMFPEKQLTEDSDIPDFEKDVLYDSELNWNIEWLNLPELANHHIYMFMHHIFQDSGTFCPADIPYIKPEDLQWQIVVEYEKFSCN